MKYIFVTGGVVSGLGKGICAASLARLLKQRGYRVQNQKFDPYLNVDPGTMSPLQHGEVFVTDDGAETDLDLGHYERFVDESLDASSSVSSGKIYWNVLTKERRGEYLGKTVQIIPHVIDEIKSFIYTNEKKGLDIAICEIGGTVGDIESQPFLEAIRQVAHEKGKDNVLFIHVPLVVEIPGSGELKSKPVQRSVRELQSAGIQPDILVCRSPAPLPEELKAKISMFCNLEKECVIENLTASSIYEVPLLLEEEGLTKQVLRKLSLDQHREPNLSAWKAMVEQIKNAHRKVKIALVGKYVALHDSYLSVEEALFHAASSRDAICEISWIDSEKINKSNAEELLGDVDGVLIPGGFGTRGIEGMVEAARYAREHDLPLLGICLGMQIVTIEYGRNVLHLKNADSTEFNPTTPHPVIDLSCEQVYITDKGATMRLGAYPCRLKEGSLAQRLYGQDQIEERHRPRYEFNNAYLKSYEDSGFLISGRYERRNLVEIVEIPRQTYYIACQFHPEFKSRPDKPHPLFVGLIAAALLKGKKA
ncbi:MAG: CTP synthase [Bacilli bacterium]|nr:CTP synthase [Bacilli bacterium]